MQVLLTHDGHRKINGKADIYVTDEAFLKILSDTKLAEAVLALFKCDSIIIENLGKEVQADTYQDVDTYKLSDEALNLDEYGGLGFYERIKM